MKKQNSIMTAFPVLFGFFVMGSVILSVFHQTMFSVVLTGHL